MINGDYIMVLAPEGYPGKKYRGRYAYEHHVVWWEAYGTLVALEENMHHKNRDKRDNSLDNLEIHTKGKHSEIHGLKPFEETNIKLECACCKKLFWKNRRNYNFGSRRGQIKFYCSHLCALKDTSIDVLNSKRRYC